MDLAKYAELFQSESREQLSAMNEALLALERAPTASEPVSAVFRAVHTIKGMSATMGYTTVTALAHELESLLDRVRHAEILVDHAVTDALFASVDALERAVEIEVAGGSAASAAAPALDQLRALASARPCAPLPLTTQEFPIPSTTQEFAVPGAAAPAVSKGPRTIRIELRRLDALMNLVGELVIARGRLTDVAHEIANPALDETLAQASRLIADLHEEIMTSRMVPVWQVFDRFPAPRPRRRPARSARRSSFTIDGKEIELDRSMLDEIGDPIVHLLRNAVDHGIEQPDVPRARGEAARRAS